MKIGVFGTGDVGHALATRLAGLGHEVMMGSRTRDNEKARAWVEKTGGKAAQGSYEDAARFGELLVNCTKGDGALEVLKQAGAANLEGKVLVDISNPLDFSKGFPPSLTVCNTDSLGEQLQRAFPAVKVVKTLNTMSNPLMVNPRMMAANHVVFLSGNDAGAKATVRGLLESFGWRAEEIVDLGDITTARGTEMILPLWVRLYGALQSPMFNFALVKPQG